MPSPRNHFIIGLGGTGGNIIRALRKAIYQNYRAEEPPTVNLRYLYLDTSGSNMAADDPKWKILGHSVQLPEVSQMLIRGLNLREIVDNLAGYPGMRPWLGDRNAWQEIIGAADAANTVGGQKRRLGRFLFAAVAANFRDRILRAAGEMQRHDRAFPRTMDTTFHVCCGLAGGTGSGSIVDAVSQIRAAFPNPIYRINIYAQLPERNPNFAAGENYHANGYAALRELNALSLRTWRPHDVTGVNRERLDMQDPFNCCYLFSEENEAGVAVDAATELPEIVASFLFHKIVEIHNIQWREDDTLLRQETGEIGGQALYPESSAKGRPRRTRNFFSFGIKQVAYPETEIREYLTYSFARQATLQLLYNNWTEGQGFREEAVNQSFHEYVRDEGTLERWCLTDERLTLSEGILPDEINNRNWRRIGDFWPSFVPSVVDNLIVTHKGTKKAMLSELTKACEKLYLEQYRGAGVLKFYETKRADMRDQVREIRGRIETNLFGEWKQGVRSMLDISRLLSAMVDSLDERFKAMDDRIARQGEGSSEFDENAKRVKKNREEWVKPGYFADLRGKYDEILRAQGNLFITRYTMMTRREGLRYAKDLLMAVRQELQNLASEVSQASARLTEVTKGFQTAIGGRVADAGRGDLTKQVVKFYEPEQVRSFAKALITDPAEQRKQTSRVRDRVAELLGERQTFTAFNAAVSNAALIDALESTCEQSSREAHEEHLARHPDHGKLLGVSILELLRREFDGQDERLRTYASGVMGMARNYLRMEAAQVRLEGPGIPNAADPATAVCTTNLTIIAPEAPELRAFRDRFCTSLKNAASTPTQVVSNPNRPQEITLINITSIFPARFSSLVGFLRGKYEARLSGDRSGRAYLELHSEGEAGALPEGQELPSLFPETFRPNDLRPWLMIAQALELIRMEPDARTGVRKCYLVQEDADGFPVVEELGPSPERVLESADAAVFELIQDAVQTRLDNEYLHRDKRAELLGAIRETLKESIRGLSTVDPRLKEWQVAMGKVKELLGLAEEVASGR